MINGRIIKGMSNFKLFFSFSVSIVIELYVRQKWIMKATSDRPTLAHQPRIMMKYSIWYCDCHACSYWFDGLVLVAFVKPQS